MSAFKVGSFNLVVSFTVMTLAIAGMGTLPFYVNYLFDGEKPAPKDDYQKYIEQRNSWEHGNRFMKTQWQQLDEQRDAVEAKWKKLHATVMQ